ncbi:hypothetical protein HK097_007619 [Rhizophlyctis rosea]|uniref:Uncharacterized protein n=1 Tax=Rhizophlyctis rosea TaxID=64517 RepID=A0AAD5SEH1_9FUNG|nr:hypothetical protein HK097_007619 [Rhizophlyctis rosea]
MSSFSTPKFTPADDAVLTAPKNKIAAEANRPRTSSWPEDDSKVIVALIHKHDHDHSRQQLAELYLGEYLIPGGEWKPELQTVVTKIKNEKQNMAKAAKREQ